MSERGNAKELAYGKKKKKVQDCDKGKNEKHWCIWEEATKSRVCILLLLFRMQCAKSIN